MDVQDLGVSLWNLRQSRTKWEEGPVFAVAADAGYCDEKSSTERSSQRMIAHCYCYYYTAMMMAVTERRKHGEISVMLDILVLMKMPGSLTYDSGRVQCCLCLLRYAW